MGAILSSSTNNSTKENMQTNTQIPFDLQEYVINEDILQKNGLKGYYLKFNNKRKLPVIENFKDKIDYIKNNSNVKYISIVPMSDKLEEIRKMNYRVAYKELEKFKKEIKEEKNLIFISIIQNINSGVANRNFYDYKIIKEKFMDIKRIDQPYETRFVFGDEKKSIEERPSILYKIKENIKKNNKKNNKRINNNN